MWDLLNRMRDQAATPIRRIVNIFVRPDPRTGDSVALPVDGQETTLSKDGSPDTVHTRFAQFHDCGHSFEVPLGGQCFSCGALSCVHCHRQCHVCSKPIGLECSRQFEQEQGQPVQFCRPCWEAAARRRLAKRIALGLLGPFIEVDRQTER